jgi:hypothetical protein
MKLHNREIPDFRVRKTLGGLKEGQSFADGIFGKLGYTVNLQLIHDVLAMRLNGLCAYLEKKSDLLRSPTFS